MPGSLIPPPEAKTLPRRPQALMSMTPTAMHRDGAIPDPAHSYQRTDALARKSKRMKASVLRPIRPSRGRLFSGLRGMALHQALLFLDTLAYCLYISSVFESKSNRRF